MILLSGLYHDSDADRRTELRECLRRNAAKVLRCRIDQHAGITIGDDDRGPGSLVARIDAGADRALAADHRNSRAGSCSEKQKLNLHVDQL